MVRAARVMATALKRAMARAARAMAMVPNKRALMAVARAMATMTKRAMASVARAMAMGTRVSGEGQKRQQRGQWQQ